MEKIDHSKFSVFSCFPCGLKHNFSFVSIKLSKKKYIIQYFSNQEQFFVQSWQVIVKTNIVEKIFLTKVAS